MLLLKAATESLTPTACFPDVCSPLGLYPSLLPLRHSTPLIPMVLESATAI